MLLVCRLAGKIFNFNLLTGDIAFFLLIFLNAAAEGKHVRFKSPLQILQHFHFINHELVEFVEVLLFVVVVVVAVVVAILGFEETFFSISCGKTTAKLNVNDVVVAVDAADGDDDVVVATTRDNNNYFECDS